jgi:hypothetical protein
MAWQELYSKKHGFLIKIEHYMRNYSILFWVNDILPDWMYMFVVLSLCPLGFPSNLEDFNSQFEKFDYSNFAK